MAHTPRPPSDKCPPETWSKVSSIHIIYWFYLYISGLLLVLLL
jgi:hypothetical protein